MSVNVAQTAHTWNEFETDPFAMFHIDHRDGQVTLSIDADLWDRIHLEMDRQRQTAHAKATDTRARLSGLRDTTHALRHITQLLNDGHPGMARRRYLEVFW